jgi:hypothetical protein
MFGERVVKWRTSTAIGCRAVMSSRWGREEMAVPDCVSKVVVVAATTGSGQRLRCRPPLHPPRVREFRARRGSVSELDG